MKRFIPLPAAAAAAALAVWAAWPAIPGAYEVGGPDTAQLTERAQALVQQFAGKLQGELKAALTGGGPTRAIPVCSDAAPAIAAALSRESGSYVRRVSLKARNPQSIPDAWEQAVLQGFEAAVAGGQEAAGLTAAEVVDEPAGRYFRFVKAIPTQELCLVCHGADIAPETARVLDERYPHDTARGYTVGTVRGAFTVKIPIPE